MDARISALLDKQEIKEVVLRYCRGIDRRDFNLVRDCYHSDAYDHHGSFSGNVDEFIGWVGNLTKRYRWTMHMVGNVLVDLGACSDDRAVAACETYGVSFHRSDDSKPYMNLATGFRYLDRFEQRSGNWKIAERTALGEWSIKLSHDIWWETPDDQLSGRRDSNDALYTLLASIRSE